jgi:4-hydroxy-3-methylbut-2-enyl diphosphate reductase
MKQFNVPEFYRSPVISKVKEWRRVNDPRKKDISPTCLDFGKVQFFLARHFGFCYGVENAIEIAFKAIEENPNKRIFLLSEMIHNPEVNKDLAERGLRFLQNTEGKQLIPFDELGTEDVVVIPAFGASLPVIQQLEQRGIATETYNTTCPFVERVWKKSEQIGQSQHSIVIHGKYNHEETRATFSRSERDAAAVVVIRDLAEAEHLRPYILQQKSQADFESQFAGTFSKGFNIATHFQKIGVINQTTMLATETQEIADYLKGVMEDKFGAADIKAHFADTRDTLCYATKENQDATLALLQTSADMAIVVGGHNSSNTQHLVELCEQKFKTYFIASANDMRDEQHIRHYNLHHKTHQTDKNYLPQKNPVKIILTSGASCPDAMLDQVIAKINGFYRVDTSAHDVLKALMSEM